MSEATPRRCAGVLAAACTQGKLRRALSPTFPAGELVFFIPWRVVAENPARRISTCSGRLGGAAAAGRTMVMSPAAPDSFSVILRFGADWFRAKLIIKRSCI